MMNRKGIDILITNFVVLFFICTTASAATDWGTDGVSDTTKVKNVLQLTSTETAADLGQSSFMGGSYPEYNTGNVQPWRKDGAWITFTSEIGGTSESYTEVCKIKPDGSSFTRLTNNSVKDSNASFSTDNKLYYNVNTLNSGIPIWKDQVWRMTEEGTAQTNLSAVHAVLDENEKSVIVSSDGSMIAYLKGNVLMVADSDGTSPSRVSGTYNAGANDINVSEGQYSWSPDAQWLAYTGSDGDGYWIYKVKSDGSSHTQLTLRGIDLADIFHRWPSWSPNGEKIAFRWQRTIFAPHYRSYYELRVINAVDGTTMQTLDNADTDATAGWYELLLPASWSPDSKWLAYTKKWQDTISHVSIFIVNTEESSPVPSELTTGYYDYFPIWAPDGSQIVFQSGSYKKSREDDCSPNCVDRGDLLLLNMIGVYEDSKPFPWPMFMPAMQQND